MKTEFFIPMLPPETTHQTKQVAVVKGKPQFYEPTELKEARSKLSAHLARHVPPVKYTGAIRVIVKWCFPITGKHQDGEYKITKPDLDNAVKLLMDVMVSLGFFKDDAIVSSLILEKFWAAKPGIYISIESLEGR